MKRILATLSIAALIALPGCCCKKKEQPQKPAACMKKDDKKKSCDMKKSCKDHEKPKKGCKSCKDKDDTSYSKHSFLELEAADEFLL